MASSKIPPIYARVRQILESARNRVARSVNTTQVVANWLVGQEIIEEEQRGQAKAGYGERLLKELSAQLRKEFGNGYSVDNLELFRRFYQTYPELISDAVRRKLGAGEISDAVRRKSAIEADLPVLAPPGPWQPGRLHPNLSWTHYRKLVRIEQPEKRAFYEIESVKNHWVARELERQVDSLLYERLAKNRDKAGLLKLAAKGQQIQQAADIFKDPVVIEFLGLPESHKLAESSIEEALISNLQTFLLELGKGFAFVARQKRITLDGDHFYIDLVFYHTILKCYVILDLKTGALTHQDLGQLQLYVNFYDREICTEGDNPTLGLILCTDKNDAVVKYTLGVEQQKTIFTSRYKLHLPTEKELQAEVRRELKELNG